VRRAGSGGFLGRLVRPLPPNGAHRRCRGQRVCRQTEGCKLDVDANGATAMRYNVRASLPCCCSRVGSVVEQRVGAIGKSEVQKMLEPHV